MTQPIKLPKGPDLDDAKNPWLVDDGRPPNHQFQGYVLDDLRRPTFRYLFETVQVEDFLKEATDQQSQKMHLQRSIAMTSVDDRREMSFRIASSNDITKTDDGSFMIDGRLKIRVSSDHSAEILETDELKQLRVPLDLVADKKQELLIEYSWD